MHPHRVCCQPTPHQFAQACILTVYVANLHLPVRPSMHPHRVCCQPTPTSSPKHASSPCMLPTYTYQFAQACILTVYVANLHLPVRPSMHPHRVCCQPTPTSSPNHASSPCMLPTYTYQFAQPCILTVYVANLHLPVRPSMHPHRVCCQPTSTSSPKHASSPSCRPTAYQFAQACILTVYVADLQPTSSPKHASSPCMLPTYTLPVRPTIPPHPLADLQPTSSPKHAFSPCMLPTYSLHAKRALQTNWVVPDLSGMGCLNPAEWFRLLDPCWCELGCSRQRQGHRQRQRQRHRQAWHIIPWYFILKVIPLASFFLLSSHI